jgi:hypothetical protein
LRVRFVLGSLAAHLAALALLARVREEGRPTIELMEVELAAAPAPPPTTTATPPAPAVEAPAPAPAPPARKRPRPRPEPAAEEVVPPTAPAAGVEAPLDPRPNPIVVPVASAGPGQPMAAFGELSNAQLAGRSGAPAPRSAGLLQRVDADVQRLQGSTDHLSFLLRTWQHNDYVAACLRDKIARTTGAVHAGAAARGRIYAALARSDRRALEAELARLRRTTVDLQVIEQASRACLDRVSD